MLQCQLFYINKTDLKIMQKPLQVRLVGRFRFRSKLPGIHDNLLYSAIHCQTNQLLILKGEEIKTNVRRTGVLSLLQQGKLYQNMQGGLGIPYMHWCGQEEDYNFVVLEQLGLTLQQNINRCKGKLTAKTSLMVASELIPILQYFHYKFFVFNNLNPRHILSGMGQKIDKFFIVDYSRAFRYRDPQTEQHSAQTQKESRIFSYYNMQFSSKNYQKGYTVSRRDDMESLLYLLSYMINGELPWSVDVRNRQLTDYQRSIVVLRKKEEKFQGLFKGYPTLQSLYSYTLGLGFQEKPHYELYTSTFAQVTQKTGEMDDRVFDWMLIDQQEEQEITHRFDLYENQSEILDRVQTGASNIKSNDQVDVQHSKTLEKQSKMKQNGEKQCQIY